MSSELRAARERVVRKHMESESRLDFDATIATFTHPRYGLMASGEVFDGPSPPSSNPEPLSGASGGQGTRSRRKAAIAE